MSSISTTLLLLLVAIVSVSALPMSVVDAAIRSTAKFTQAHPVASAAAPLRKLLQKPPADATCTSSQYSMKQTGTCTDTCPGSMGFETSKMGSTGCENFPSAVKCCFKVRPAPAGIVWKFDKQKCAAEDVLWSLGTAALKLTLHAMMQMDYTDFAGIHPECSAVCDVGSDKHGGSDYKTHCFFGCSIAASAVNTYQNSIYHKEPTEESCRPGAIDFKGRGITVVHTKSGHDIPCICGVVESQLDYRDMCEMGCEAVALKADIK